MKQVTRATPNTTYHPPMNDVRLLQLSDTHLFASPEGTLRGTQTLPSLQRVLAAAAPHVQQADALLVTGDIANDDAGGYGHFRRLLERAGRPVYCVPGNHDDPQALAAALPPPFQVGGHVDLGGWRLVLLDSCVPGQAGGRLHARELARLEHALDSADNRHVLIALHHHPVSMGSRWLDGIGVANAGEFFDVIDRRSSVRAVVWGHVHQSFDQRRRGVRLLATPATCAQFLPGSDDFRVDQRPPAYRRLLLGADGTLETEVLWVAADAATLPAAGNG
jgi:Icc protein